MRINKIDNNYLNFTRRLSRDEEKDYRQNAIKPALDYLGVKEMSMIIHGTSFPESRIAQSSGVSDDIGVGSPYGKMAAQLIPFEILHGFNSIQLGPVGELQSVTEVSPYASSIKAKNYLFIDFTKLTEKEYANLLDSSDITSIVSPVKNSDLNYSNSDFPEAFANYKKLIKTAYSNFNKKIERHDEDALKLGKEFHSFMKSNPEVSSYALFYLLKDIYGTDDFTKWKDIDKNLVESLKNGDADSHIRVDQLKLKTGSAFGEYCFAQFIMDKQIKENAEFRKQHKFKYISDMLVGFSPSDEWVHQDLFLKGYKIGCPYGGPDGGLQKWNVPILDPKKLFNQDGSLGEAGKYLRTKLEMALDNFDNVRIDHALGLVDPYVYDQYGGRRGNIGRMHDLDPDGNYQKVLEKIILPVLEEHNLDKNSPVWEDLVTETPEFNYIYHEKFKIPGITPLEYKKAEGMEDSENWTLIGSHDSRPAMDMIKQEWVRHNDAWNPMYLAGVLNAAHDSSKYCEKIASDDTERVKAKFAELFMMGKKIQVFFADFFGIPKRYNEGGNDKNPDNWKLRLNNNYEDTYYKNLSSDTPTAVNMPEILKLALRGKADMNIVRNHQNPDDVNNEIAPILEKLEQYENILKEKE